LGLYIYAGEDIPSVDNSDEIAAAIAMIDQAIETDDHDYISKYWQTSISNVWASLGDERVDKLNKMIGELT